MNRFRSGNSVTGIPVAFAAALLFTVCVPAGHAQTGDTAGAPTLEATFDKSVNTKSAKVDDMVVAKETKAAKLKDGTNVPKGSKLMGKIVAVQSIKDGSGTASLAIKFDHVQIKGGSDVPIQGLITAIGPSHVATADDSVASSAGSSSGPSRGGGGGGGGLSGGGGARSAPSAPAAVVGLPSMPTAPTLTAGSTLEGVSLGEKLDANGANELRAEKKDIKLDSDVMFKLALQ